MKRDQAKELVDKECDINNGKLDNVVERLDEKLQSGLDAQIRSINRRQPGPDSHKEQALVIINEAVDEAGKKKLELLRKKQFFEMQKQLGNLAAAVEADKIISEMTIKAKYKDDEADAIGNLGGTDLADKLDELKAKREQ